MFVGCLCEAGEAQGGFLRLLLEAVSCFSQGLPLGLLRFALKQKPNPSSVGSCEAEAKSC